MSGALPRPQEGLDGPPDTRGPTAPVPGSIFALGWLALGLVILGTIAIILVHAQRSGPISQLCVDQKIEPRAEGARGVCSIVESALSRQETFVLLAGIAVGVLAMVGGFSRYRSMPSRRQREHCIAGAVLGIQAAALAALMLLFRGGQVGAFASNFLNLSYVSGRIGDFASAARITLTLAFTGEIGGIVIGLFLSMLALSSRRVVRAPARAYINFFRGTPLIWQLAFAYFGVALGLDVGVISPLVIAWAVFSLNTGAYAAEVFRAGLQSIERGQIEAARSLGMSYGQAMRYAIVPQAVRRVIPPLMNEFVILIKDTSLITVMGLVASQRELYSVGRDIYSATYNATPFLMSAMGYLVVTLPLIRLVNAIEKRLRSGLVSIAGAS
ncbi:MAG: amino acid ABC transporter permease [Actinobacteria bacterium]|nr:amino acid ABC transporter permease [Actinomycetota bacterium]